MSSPADGLFRMSALVHRLVTFLLAFLLLVNAAGASVVDRHGGSCCSESIPRALLVAPPCHEEPTSPTHCYDGERDPVAPTGSACGDPCPHCAGHQTSSPVGAPASAPPALVLPALLERTPLSEPVAPPGHRERLERPPSLASLN